MSIGPEPVDDRVTPRVSVVIVHFNGIAILERCLSALSAVEYPADRLEVIVVDNGSTDGSADRIESSFPWVRVLRLSVNRGFCGGNNEGLRVSSAPLIVFLNNDTEVEPGWLWPLVSAMVIDDRVGIAGSKLLLHGAQRRLQSTGLVLYSDGNGGDRGYGETDTGQYDDDQRVFGACGASIIVRRTLLDEIGAFEPWLFMYCEDLDLAWRARLRGWEVRYVPESRVLHEHGATAFGLRPFFVFHMERNRVAVNWRNAPLRLALRASASLLWRTSRAWMGALIRPSRERVQHAATLSRAVGSLVRAAGSLASARSVNRGRARRVTDREIALWMRPWRPAR